MNKVSKYIPHQALVINQIIDKTHLQYVYLFGSYAKKKNTTNSDVDLCLVYQSDAQAPDLAQLRLALKNVPLAFDLLAFREDDFNAQKPIWWSIPAQVQQEGVMLYDASSHR